MRWKLEIFGNVRMKIIWALIFIHMSGGQPVAISTIATFANKEICQIAAKIYDAEKQLAKGYFTCLKVHT